MLLPQQDPAGGGCAETCAGRCEDVYPANYEGAQ